MTVTTQQIQNLIETAWLGGKLDSSMPVSNVVDLGARFAYRAHSWQWTQQRSSIVGIRATISGQTTCSWDKDTLTLTKSNAWTSYEHQIGDRILINAGTGVTQGHYAITAKTDASNLVLEDISPTQAAGFTAADVGFDDIKFDFTLLPADVDDLLDVQPQNSVANIAEPVDHQTIVKLRTNNNTTEGNVQWFWAVVHTGAPARKGLELYPTPNEDDPLEWVITYRSGWPGTDNLGDEEPYPIPDWFELFFLECVRAVATGWDEWENMDPTDLLTKLRRGVIFEDARASDNRAQPSFGCMQGTIAQTTRRRPGRYHLRSTVSDPEF